MASGKGTFDNCSERRAADQTDAAAVLLVRGISALKVSDEVYAPTNVYEMLDIINF